MGRIRSKNKDVLIEFSDLTMKSLILDALWEQLKLIVEGQELTFYSDLCPLTFKKEGMKIHHE